MITTERLKNPQQLNLYAYVAQPLRFIDPTGEILNAVGNEMPKRVFLTFNRSLDATRSSIDEKLGLLVLIGAPF